MLRPLHSENGTVQEDILSAGQLGVEAGADLEQARQTSFDLTVRTSGRDARQDLEHRALARTIATDNAEHLALGELERDVLDRPDLLVVRPVVAMNDPAPAAPASREASRTRRGTPRSDRASKGPRRRPRSSSDRVRELGLGRAKCPGDRREHDGHRRDADDGLAERRTAVPTTPHWKPLIAAVIGFNARTHCRLPASSPIA